MRAPTVLPLALTLFAAGACEPDPPAARARENPAKVEPARPQAEQPQPLAAKPDPGPPPASAEAPPEIDVRASAAALQAGRVFAKKGKSEEALRAFEVAVRKNPTGGSALCEAGWAAFKLKQPAKARAYLGRGISVANDKTKPACLYNLGRVEEDAKAPALAAAHYKASLALRPNETVQARLDGLGDVDAPTCERPWSNGILGLESMPSNPVGSPHAVTDARSLVLRVNGEKPTIWLAVENTQSQQLQTLGILAVMEIEEHASKFEATFEVVDDTHVELAYRFAYKDEADLERWALTGYEEGCEDWAPEEPPTAACRATLKKMFAASKRFLHVVCDVSDADAFECSQPYASRKRAMAALEGKECLSWDCCFGEPVE
ncbi:MAG: tetratricopeptide repeat protein [Myxococcota bacterium]